VNSVVKSANKVYVKLVKEMGRKEITNKLSSCKNIDIKENV